MKQYNSMKLFDISELPDVLFTAILVTQDKQNPLLCLKQVVL